MKNLLLRTFGALVTAPFRLRTSRVAPPTTVTHTAWIDVLAESFNKPGMRVLEIGSRNVTGISHRNRFSEASYTGFDFYAGENVDVVGDAHNLSDYFDEEQKFDLIFSSAVFEHLCMPWRVAEQIADMLVLGGCVFVETHFAFSAHERPWNFFQFSDKGLRALFNAPLGFDVIDSGMSDPIAGFYTHEAADYIRYKPVTELYCHSEIYCRKTRIAPSFDWKSQNSVTLSDDTRYPAPE